MSVDWIGDPEYRPAIIGMAGVAVGSIIGLFGTWVATRSAGRMNRQGELRRMYAEMLETLEAEDSLQMEGEILEERLSDFYEHLGTDEPTPDLLRTLDQSNRENYEFLLGRLRELSGEQAGTVGRLSHLSLQARLIAPRDTGTVVQALIFLKMYDRDPMSLDECFVLFGRRDIAATFRGRARAHFDVRRAKWTKKYRAAIQKRQDLIDEHKGSIGD